MATEAKGAFFDEFVQGGGRLDDVDLTIKSARFSSWDYKGKVNPPVLALAIQAQLEDGSEPEPEFLSSGDLRFFVPSDDGKKAIPVGNASKLNINTNAAAFIMSIINADTRGEMAAKLRSTDDVSVLDGLKVHVVQKAQPKRPGIVSPEMAAAGGVAGAARREPTQLLVERIIKYPWEGTAQAPAATIQAPVAAAAAPATAAAAPAAAGAPAGALASDEVMGMAAGTLMQIVAEAGGSIKKQAIAGKVFTNADMKAQPAATRNAVLGLIVKDAFLQSEAVTAMGLRLDTATQTVALQG